MRAPQVNGSAFRIWPLQERDCHGRCVAPPGLQEGVHVCIALLQYTLDLLAQILVEVCKCLRGGQRAKGAPHVVEVFTALVTFWITCKRSPLEFRRFQNAGRCCDHHFFRKQVGVMGSGAASLALCSSHKVESLVTGVQ
jgi:hypothetical protein